MTHRVSTLVLAMAIAVAAGSVITAQQVPAPAAPAPAAPLVNINTAAAADLEKLPGVGPAMAARIIEYRQKNGAFKKTEELMNVKGIGEKSFLTLKPLITVTPPKGTGLRAGRWIGQ
jgi:competence protein ComEA